MEPTLIFKNKNFIIVNKPAGMPVHEAKHSNDYTLCDWLLERFPEIKDVGDLPAEAFRQGGPAFGQPYRPGIVHRLDKKTSGVMVVARTQQGFLRLKELFKSRGVEKIYLALVCGRLKEKSGVIRTAIGRLAKTPTKMGIDFGQGGIRLAKEAETEYRILREFALTSLLEVKPKTGRMHQIRLHLASIGHPVAGDAVYGGQNVCHKTLGRYFLHASSLAFSYRPGELSKFETDLPPDLAGALKTEAVAKN